MIAAARHCATAKGTVPQISSETRRFSFRWKSSSPKIIPIPQMMVAAIGITSILVEEISSKGSPVGEKDSEIVSLS